MLLAARQLCSPQQARMQDSSGQCQQAVIEQRGAVPSTPDPCPPAAQSLPGRLDSHEPAGSVGMCSSQEAQYQAEHQTASLEPFGPSPSAGWQPKRTQLPPISQPQSLSQATGTADALGHGAAVPLPHPARQAWASLGGDEDILQVGEHFL
jgi:hypothetical protein